MSTNTMNSSKKGSVSLHTERSGYLSRSTDGKSWARVYAILRKFTMTLYTERKEGTTLASFQLENCHAAPLDSTRASRRYAFQIELENGQVHWLASESKEDTEQWLSCVLTSAVPPTWPGGVTSDNRAKPLLYSEILRKQGYRPLSVVCRVDNNTPNNSSDSEKDPTFKNPLEPLPALDSVPFYQQRAMVLKKLRLCSVVFDIADPSVAAQEKDYKRSTLMELVDCCDKNHVIQDLRVLDDMFQMIRVNLFRALPTAPEPLGDPDEEEEPFMDPQWPHLSVVYELLLHLVSLDSIGLPVKKKLLDPTFVKKFLLLFDSEDVRERDYLKTITHRIYSKLTQRRALIRRVICNCFYEFIFETGKHNGIAEMLEILASVINGFAQPVKEEHKVMLVKALLPLHKASDVASYHPQLSYCMALYVAKDHTITRHVLPGLLRYWPVANSAKQIMFLNELDDVFEYVQSDDLEVFRKPLAHRLAKCIGSLHFQVAERTLCLWSSDRFSQLVLEDPSHRAVILPLIFDPLMNNSRYHWHDSVKTASTQILEQYMETDAELYNSCVTEWEKQQDQKGKESDALLDHRDLDAELEARMKSLSVKQ